jgi:hypothetical protein
MKELDFIFEQASTAGGKKRSDDRKTETGVKDTYQEFFLDKLSDATKKIRKTEARAQAFRQAVESFPANTISPVWQIKGISWTICTS